MKTNRVSEVNKALRMMGRQEKLTRGRGYYYFRDGDTARWYATSVYVNDASALTVGDWLSEYNELRSI